MDEMLKALQECYRHELTLAVRYVNFAVQVSGLDRLHLVELFKGNATDSIGHAEKIGAKIVAKGGTPQGKVSEDLAGAPGSVQKMLEQALKDEETAVTLYSAAVPLAKNDLALRETLVHILKDEQASVDELKLLLKGR
ncbi:MAG: ferritin-like domain-containing protein [Planctomycetes bacterium]|nr:ferritin-like domain-containing protein [Planctomycetota bacterium]